MKFPYARVGKGFMPVVPVTVSFADRHVATEALVDSGAACCIFDAQFADVLGIADLNNGDPMRFEGVSEHTILAEVIMWADGFTVTLGALLRPRGGVRFDEDTGILWIGKATAGEVTIGSKEYYFLRCLSRELGKYVLYADLKRDVLRLSGSTDTTEEATFCQKLKSRIKKLIPAIDQLMTTTNKGDGYRLRAVIDQRY